MAAKLNLEAVIGGQSTAASLASKQPSKPREALNWLISILAGVIAGITRSRFRLWFDDSAGAKATITITCVQAQQTVGDRLRFDLPGLPPVYLTAVTGTAVAEQGQYSKDTSDSAVATSVAAAINRYPLLLGLFTATPSTGTVVITATQEGSRFNLVNIAKVVTNAGAFTGTGLLTGGTDPAQIPAAVVLTLTGVIANNETVTIGPVVLTAKTAAPSGESQFLAGVSAAADGAALAACINAHSKLRGILLASGTSTVSIAPRWAGRVFGLLTFAEAIVNGTLSATSYTQPTTEAYVSAPIDYTAGQP